MKLLKSMKLFYIMVFTVILTFAFSFCAFALDGSSTTNDQEMTITNAGSHTIGSMTQKSLNMTQKVQTSNGLIKEALAHIKTNQQQQEVNGESSKSPKMDVTSSAISLTPFLKDGVQKDTSTNNSQASTSVGINWQSLVGDGNQYFTDVVNISGDSYLAVGTENTTSRKNDVFVANYNSSTNSYYSMDLGTSYDDFGVSVKKTSDGGYAILSYTVDTNYNVTTHLTKLNSALSIVWSIVVGDSRFREGNALITTNDGGFLIAATEQYVVGSSDIDMAAIKVSSGGSLVWERTFGTSSAESGRGIALTNDGGYVMCGSSNSDGSSATSDSNMLVVKFASDGTWQWKDTFNADSLDDIANSIVQNSNGDISFTGTYPINSNLSRLIHVILSSSGQVKFSNLYGTLVNNEGYSIQTTTDGGYVIAGTTFSSSTNSEDAYLIKTDAYGNYIWDKSVGDTGYEGAYSVIQTSDGGYVGVGESNTYGECGYIFKMKTIDPLPSIITSDPASGATNVAVNKSITLTFSENIQPGSFYNNIYLVDNLSRNISFSKSISGNVLVITPNANLNNDTQYTLNIPIGAVIDSAGQGNGDSTNIIFSTVSVPIGISSIDPTNGATNVAINKVITVSFSKAIQAGTAYSSIALKDSTNNSATISKSISGNILTITPSNLSNGTQYTLSLPVNCVQDTLGNGVGFSTSSTFTTVQQVTALGLASSNPSNGATNVTTGSAITVTFNKAIQAGSAYSNISLKDSANNIVTFTKTISGSILTITPTSLSASKQYTLTIPASSVQDITGIALIVPIVITFTTSAPASTMSVDKVTAKPGDQVTVKVNLSDKSGMSSGSFILQYDNTKVTPKSITQGSLIQGVTFVSNLNYATNQIRVAWMGTNAINTGGDLCSIVFEVKAGLTDQVTNLDLSQPVLKTFTDQTLPCNVVNGYIDIRTVKMGDVNMDGSIDLSDAIMVLRSYVGLDTLTSTQTKAADVTKDGSVDLSDAIKILRYYVGLETTLE